MNLTVTFLKTLSDKKVGEVLREVSFQVQNLGMRSGIVRDRKGHDIARWSWR